MGGEGGVVAVSGGVIIWVVHIVQVLCLLPTTCYNKYIQYLYSAL